MTDESVSRADELIQPDVVVPSQFFATVRRQGPAKRGEYQLLVAVLEDALHCFTKYALARDGQGRRLFREAEAWMMDDDPPVADPEAASFDFAYICEILDIDPEYIRDGLRRWQTAVETGGKHSLVVDARAGASQLHAA